MLRSTNLADRSAAHKYQLKGVGALLAETLQHPAETWPNLAEPAGESREPGRTLRNSAEPGGTRRNPAEPGGNLAETWRKPGGNPAEKK